MTPDDPTPAVPPQSIEAGLNALASDIKDGVCHQIECCEKKVREHPVQSMLVAVAAGYCLHRLPLRAILITKVRILTALAPPALLAIGAAKLCEFLQAQARGHEEQN